MIHISLSASQTHYSDCDYIIRQGATGDTFFIISEGQVRRSDEGGEEREINGAKDSADFWV